MGYPYIRKTSVIDMIPNSNSRVFWDDFEYGFHWTKDISSVGTAVKYSFLSYNGNACAALIFAAGVAQNDYISISKNFSIFSPSKFNLRFYFRIADTPNTCFFDFSVEIYNNGNTYVAAFRYDRANDKFMFLNSAGSYVDFPSPALNYWINHWQGISLDFDLQKLKYGKFYYGLQTYDLSDNDLYITSLTPRYNIADIKFKITAGATPSATTSLLLDDVSIYAL